MGSMPGASTGHTASGLKTAPDIGLLRYGGPGKLFPDINHKISPL